MPIDLAIINANIRTMDQNLPCARAIAMCKNKIVKIGLDEEVKRLIGKHTNVIDLEGKAVVPGLIDTHVHVADFGRCLMWLDLTSAESLEELKRLVHEKARETAKGKWIIGRGWNETCFKEKRPPNFLDLDEAAPQNPVILYRESAMVCVVNSKAMTSAGVTERTSVAEGGTIDRDSQTGRLTGIFRDTATSLIWQAVPEPTVDELVEAAALACRKIAEAGITSIHWILISQNELELAMRLHEEGKLPIRVNLIVPIEFLDGTHEFKSKNKSMLRLGGVFVTTDGYLDSKTAALSQPYSDDLHNSGKMLLARQELAASVDRALKMDLQPIIHAMGDKAVDTALDVIEEANSKTTTRFRMEQAAVLNKDLIKRLKDKKVVVSVQPTVIATEFAVWSAITRLGVQRASLLHPLKTLLSEGVKVAGGSDCPMEPLDPILGLHEAVNRTSFPEQRLTAEEALKMYTIDAAYSSAEENLKGSLEEGKLADLTVLSQDPLNIDPDKIKSVKVEMTVIGGKVVFNQLLDG